MQSRPYPPVVTTWRRLCGKDAFVETPNLGVFSTTDVSSHNGRLCNTINLSSCLSHLVLEAVKRCKGDYKTGKGKASSFIS
jgi:hypothetical protein